MIHETRNYRVARDAFRSGQRAPGMILRPIREGLGGYVVFDRVEDARGHPTGQTYARAFRASLDRTAT